MTGGISRTRHRLVAWGGGLRGSRLRAEGNLPIIIVSARTDTADVIDGFEAGADHDVTTPLVAAVRSV